MSSYSLSTLHTRNLLELDTPSAYFVFWVFLVRLRLFGFNVVSVVRRECVGVLVVTPLKKISGLGLFRLFSFSGA